MIVYWLMFGGAALSLVIRDNVSTGNLGQKRTYLLVLATLFALIIGLRQEVGGDWETYLAAYQRAKIASQETPFAEVGQQTLLEFLASISRDPGYSFFNWLAVETGTGIYGVNLLVGASLMAGITVFAFHQPRPDFVFLAATPYLIIVIGMGYSRQAAAIGFELIALTYLTRQKPVPYVLWLLVAALFHKAALVMMPFAALVSTRGLSWRIAWVGVTSMAAAYYLIGTDTAEHLWKVYVDAQRESSGALIRMAMNATAGLGYLVFLRKSDTETTRNYAYLILAVVAIISVPLGFFASTATDRVALYLIPLQLYVCGRMDWALGRHSAWFLSGSWGAVQFVWLNFASHAYLWVPYQVYLGSAP